MASGIYTEIKKRIEGLSRERFFDIRFYGYCDNSNCKKMSG